MPKGTKIIDWMNPQNEAKLLHSVLKHCDVSKSYGEIAKDFGDDVPIKTIATRINKIKRDAGASKPSGGSANTTPSKTGRTSAMINKGNTGDRGKKGVKGAKGAGIDSDEDSLVDEMMEKQAAAGPKTPDSDEDMVIAGRVVKARSTPRKTTKKDYKAMKDPFNSMIDAKDEKTGATIFDPQTSATEDSDPTDGEFGQKHKSSFQRTMESLKKNAALKEEAALKKEAAMEQDVAIKEEEGAATYEEAI